MKNYISNLIVKITKVISIYYFIKFNNISIIIYLTTKTTNYVLTIELLVFSKSPIVSLLINKKFRGELKDV